MLLFWQHNGTMWRFLAVIVPVVSAQGTPSIITGDIPGCNFKEGLINAGQCLPSFLAHLIQFLFGFAGGIFMLMIVFAGYEIVIGSLPGGSSEAGKNRLTWAIIGFILAATSFFIMDFIISAIGG